MAQYGLLDEFYEKEHRARLIEAGQVLPILRPRTHDGFLLMQYDCRYQPLLQQAGLHVVANLVRRGMPTFNPAALTALIDRWRPETHSFHLPCGEMTVTLQDVAMLLGLPIRGRAMIGPAVSEGWRGRVEAFLGAAPPAPAGEGAGRGCVSGILLRWLRNTFGTCPADADEQTVTYHCRAWVLHMFGAVLFPDGTGDSASWMYIHCLMDWGDAGTFSWGSAVLAFLYRQLCEACRRRAARSTMAGCTYLLQLWMWSRIPVGQPEVLPRRIWNPPGVAELAPTVAYLWDVTFAPYAITERAYLEYSNELDALSPSSVVWEPYEEPDVLALPLNYMCTRDRALFRMRCPLICFYAVEIHLPHRVSRQFNLLQSYPPEPFSTSIDLHKFDRVRQQKVTDFAHHHREMIEWWDRMEVNVQDPAEPHRNANFREYLAWYHSVTRYKLRQRWTGADYADIASSDDDNTTYDKACREGIVVELAPILDRAGTSIRDSVTDIDRFLRSPLVEDSSAAKDFLQKLQRRLKRVAARCGCRAQVLSDVAAGPFHRASGSAAAASFSHGTARQHRASGSTAAASSSTTPTFSDDLGDDDDGEQSQQQHEEIGMSQMPDAPPSSQPAQRRRRPPVRHTPGIDALGRGKGKGKRR
ncbi:unnamed protein product [Urochloa humidicola]